MPATDDPHDALMLDDDETEAEPEVTIEEAKAARLVEACECFVEALLMISEASGPDHEDDFERAYLCIERMHRIACNALIEYRFEPRRTTID
jgi:hypothetical protein